MAISATGSDRMPARGTNAAEGEISGQFEGHISRGRRRTAPSRFFSARDCPGPQPIPAPDGHLDSDRPVFAGSGFRDKSSQRGDGAGEGNRTLVVSLGSFCSTIELHPHGPRWTSACLLQIGATVKSSAMLGPPVRQGFAKSLSRRGFSSFPAYRCGPTANTMMSLRQLRQKIGAALLISRSRASIVLSQHSISAR